jgi:tetratricopeptide (TPR) repeat protein
LATNSALKSAGVSEALSAALAYLFTGRIHNESAAAGVRGENQGDSEEPGWIDSIAQVYMEAGRTFVATRHYDRAIQQFNLALDAATFKELSEVKFDLAYAYSLSGDTRQALIQVAGLESLGSEKWAPGFVLLKAKLLVDSNAFAQEIAWLTQQGNDLSGDAQLAPMYYFLLGVGYRGVSDGINEKQSLSRVTLISTESDIGKAATQLLQNP